MWSLLAWVALTRAIGVKPHGDAKGELVSDDIVVMEGWDERKADAITGLLSSFVRHPASDDQHLALAAFAQSEMGIRHLKALHPFGVQRALEVARRIEPEALHLLMTSVACRLVKLLVEAEGKRRAVPTKAQQTSLRAMPLWSCLSAMPLGTRITRSQWLQVYQTFPWMRDVMIPAAIELDPDSPIRDAFCDPMQSPPAETLADLAVRSATDSASVETALLLLTWHWSWVKESGGSSLPPLPTLDKTRIDGTAEYWRQFLFGASVVPAPGGEAMWETILSRVSQRELHERAENQAWYGALKYRERFPERNKVWTRYAEERLARLRSEGSDIRIDTRITSLIGLIALVEADPVEFAKIWEPHEQAYDCARIQKEGQQCLKLIASRLDASAIVMMSAVRARLNTSLKSGNAFIITDGLRALLASAGLQSLLEWLLTPPFHEFWIGEGRFWLDRLQMSPHKDIRECFFGAASGDQYRHNTQALERPRPSRPSP